MTPEKPDGIAEPLEDIDTEVKLPFRVILFNDDYHTFDEVIAQLIKAIKCNYEKAKSLTFEVHLKGKAQVFSGDLNKCLKVSSILQEIDLHTQIESD